MNEIEALVILSLTPGLGAIKGRQLIERFGSACEVIRADNASLSEFSGLSSKTYQAWGWWDRNPCWKKEIECGGAGGVQLIPYHSPAFPKPLLAFNDSPLLIWVKGNLEALNSESVAVVGTRNASLYGQEMAESISASLAGNGITVVSGLARGIDTKAHLGALKAGKTVAVLGSGLGNIYPKENQSLAKTISETGGAVISEFSYSEPPAKHHFPKRNRIVSGMSLGALLIEAPLKSGAMITMEMAADKKKKLFALPGRADSDSFKGNHRLIKEGSAMMVESAEDLLQSIGKQFILNGLKNINCDSSLVLEKEESELLQMMPKEELNIEDLVKITKLPIIKLNILLMGLILKQAVKEYPGKIYKKRP